MLLIAAFALSACAGASPSAPAEVPGTATPSTGPASTPVTPPSPPESPTPGTAGTPSPVATPDSGNVEEPPSGPVLTIEPDGRGTIRATLEDPTAKAWRIVVAGTGQLAADRFEVTVETGDVAPSVLVTEIRDGQVVSVMDLGGFGDPTAAAGGCHGRLPVCVDADSIRLPRHGDGRLAVDLERTDTTTEMTVTGATAGWPGEPFILGPWTGTEAFPWGPAAG
jgi:hypothetical protein